MNTKKIKPTKKLVIQHPRLRAIRDNFRTIIKLAVIDEYDRLDELETLYIKKNMELYRKKKKELSPSQFKRSSQLHQLQEYLITTFSNSICVCAKRRSIHDMSIEGDRVRYSFISEFDECVIESFGARYKVEEKWFSLEYYEQDSAFFENYLGKMRSRVRQLPDNVITALDSHLHYLNNL